MQMLAKAQNSYIQSKTTSETDQPKPIGNWPNDYHLNSNTYVKPEAIRIQPTTANTTIVSPTSSTSSKSQETLTNSQSKSQLNQSINPIIQRLLSTPTTSASTTIISNQNETSFNDTSNNELLSLDLKRKLNIIKHTDSDNAAILMTPNNLTTVKSNLFSPAKNLMTVKDFEENLLANEVIKSSSILNENITSEAQLLSKLNQSTKPQTMFYLEHNQRPNKLAVNEINDNTQKTIKLKQEFKLSTILPTSASSSNVRGIKYFINLLLICIYFSID